MIKVVNTNPDKGCDSYCDIKMTFGSWKVGFMLKIPHVLAVFVSCFTSVILSFAHHSILVIQIRLTFQTDIYFVSLPFDDTTAAPSADAGDRRKGN